MREHGQGGRVLARGSFLEVRRDDVRLPDGASATREYVVHPGAVMIVPLLAAVAVIALADWFTTYTPSPAPNDIVSRSSVPGAVA